MFRTESSTGLRISVLMVVVLIWLAGSPEPVAYAEPVVTSENGRITVQAEPMMLSILLKQLVQAAQVELLIVEPIAEDTLVRADFNRMPLEQILDSLLKRNSYAIVYNSGQSEVYFSDAAVVGQVAPDAAIDESGQFDPLGESASFLRADAEQQLLQKIRTLEERIRSGISDREYERWASVRDPKYVVHDRDLLAEYHEKLNSLTRY
jgi:hypothetical protein